MKTVAFAVVGVRNFAQSHIRTIKKLEEEGIGRLQAVVVRDQEGRQDGSARLLQELEAQGVVLFDSYEQLLQEGQGLVDLITLPVAVHAHYDLAKQGMEAGYSLVLEKPPVPTVQQVDDLICLEQQTGQFCSVGFQMIHSPSLRKLKEEVCAGRLGELKEITCRGYWPRDGAYYSRNGWAGRAVVDGMLVLDGPIHNALAHYLNNMIFISGPALDTSADLRWIRAELYRSRPFITSDDTSCLEAETTAGTHLYFYVTHSPRSQFDPVMEVVGTKGTATWNYEGECEIETQDGTERFDNGGVDPWLEVMRVSAKVHRGELARPYSTLANSRSFVVAINGAYDSARYIRPIPQEFVESTLSGPKECAVVKDIDELLDQACAQRKLLSDLGVPWAVSTPRIDLQDYKEFSPFSQPRTFVEPGG